MSDPAPMPAYRQPMRQVVPVAVHLLFITDRRVLLLRRFNTGWGDGLYSVPAGHVDLGESVTQAGLREAYEETGARLVAEDLAFVHVMHRRSDEYRVDFFLRVEHWTGTLSNREPDKCDDLAWFPINALPVNTVPYVRQALSHVLQGITFSEFGW